MNTKSDICARVVEQLPIYTDGELGSQESLAISTHLDACSTCRKSATEEQALVAGCIDALVAEEPSADLARRIIAATIPSTSSTQITLEEIRQRRIRDRVPNRSLFSWQSAAAAILVLVVGGIFAWMDQEPTSPEIAFQPPVEGVDGDEVAAPPPVTPVTDRSLDDAPQSVVDAHSGAQTSTEPEEVGADPTRTSPGDTTFRIVRGDVDADGDFDFADLALFGIILESPERAAEIAPCPAAGDMDEDHFLTPSDQIAFVTAINRAGTDQASFGGVPRFIEYSRDSGLECSTVSCP